MTRQKKTVFEVLKEERDYQDQKWGSLEEHSHTLPEWLEIMNHYLLSAASQVLEPVFDEHNSSALFEIQKLTAVGIAVLEQYYPIQRDVMKGDKGGSAETSDV